jgi:FkbM family methyltransferase
MSSVILKRIISLKNNVTMLSPLMSGFGPSFCYILKSKGKPLAEGCASYKGLNFTFRRSDLSAVKEILDVGEYDFLEELMDGNETPYVYDLGGHIGLFAMRVLSINPKANVLSLEASPGTFDVLKRNLERNQKSCPNWSIKNGAAWKNQETIKFENTSGSTMSHRVDKDGQVSVPGITYGDIIMLHSKGAPIDIMKIDIEGAEEAFLCDGNADFSNVKNLIVELHPNYCDVKRVRSLLEKHFTKIIEKHDSSLSKPLLLCQK